MTGATFVMAHGPVVVEHHIAHHRLTPQMMREAHRRLTPQTMRDSVLGCSLTYVCVVIFDCFVWCSIMLVFRPSVELCLCPHAMSVSVRSAVCACAQPSYICKYVCESKWQ